MGSAQVSRLRRVAIYGRVSTEHEAQLSAFENQQAWYEGVARRHKFDLIVTREVCRFARNTVDTLTVTRELSKIGIEVYFIQDNIWTMDGDGELRLTIMATLAQEESRKISERVRAGQQISREKGVLYGTGNILGYNRSNGTYVIDPEQAYVVRKIFQLYADGWGYKRICAELTRLACKNAHGEVDWKLDRIGRILRNATYKGYIGYNKSHSSGYLEQKRVNHREEDFVYVKGNFEPIVSEELWNRCEELRLKKSARQLDEEGKPRRFCRKEPQSVWSSKLRCSCGSSFRRFLWHQNADGKKTYGYECYRQKREVSEKYLRAHGLDASQSCNSKSIPFWHIDLMALSVFRAVWGEQKEAVLLACKMIEECAAAEGSSTSSLAEALKAQMAALMKKQEGLRGMCAMGDITREVFLRDNQNIQEELETLQMRLNDLESQESASPVSALDMNQIRCTLDKWMDFSGPLIPETLIDQFILQVVVVDDDTFNWTLDLSAEMTPEQRRMTPSEIALQLYREKQHVEAGNGACVDSILGRHITDPQTLLSFTVTKADAEAYCHSIGMKFFGKKWRDKTVIVSI